MDNAREWRYLAGAHGHRPTAVTDSPIVVVDGVVGVLIDGLAVLRQCVRELACRRVQGECARVNFRRIVQVMSHPVPTQRGTAGTSRMSPHRSHVSPAAAPAPAHATSPAARRTCFEELIAAALEPLRPLHSPRIHRSRRGAAARGAGGRGRAAAGCSRCSAAAARRRRGGCGGCA